MCTTPLYSGYWDNILLKEYLQSVYIRAVGRGYAFSLVDCLMLL